MTTENQVATLAIRDVQVLIGVTAYLQTGLIGDEADQAIYDRLRRDLDRYSLSETPTTAGYIDAVEALNRRLREAIGEHDS